jgi:gamma-glutamyltranspeptidase/glutathione hydrolase
MLRFFLSIILLSAPFPALSQEAADAVAPEAAGAGIVAASEAADAAQVLKAAGKPVEAKTWMVAAANPLAVDAGARVLRDGGTAADAMVAVQAVLGLVEPQSSGLGGGAFLVWYDTESGDLTTLDGRETAPLNATPRLFQHEDGEPMGFFDAVVGGRSVGTPGTPLLMKAAHDRWGKSDWSTLFSEAIALAEEGFAVGPRMAGAVAADAERLSVHASTRAYFLPDGQPLAAGHVLRNPEYAESVRTLAEQGPAPFYIGDIARDIVSTVQGVPNNPGVLSLADFAIYRVVERDAVCADYRGYDVCGMGPPSSGALTVGQILGLLNRFDLSEMGPESVEAWRLIGDASRLAFADRGRYMADSDYVPVPVKGLTDPGYFTERSELLERDDALTEVSPGNPEFDHALNWSDDQSLEFPSTSHISIVDQYGNALSMTTTIENGFGSRLMVRGFLLNNELTDFSFRSHVDGVPIANRIEPGKRPRSSMAPTIVMRDGVPKLVVGSPGGSRIIGYVAKTIVAHVDWGMDVQAAIDLPHLVNRFGSYDVEAGKVPDRLSTGLADIGFDVNARDLNSGIHAISMGDILMGGADNRREGIALGD